MRDWPPIAEPELVERLGLGDEQFAAFFQDLIAAWPRREFDPAAFEQALGYPFSALRGRISSSATASNCWRTSTRRSGSPPSPPSPRTAIRSWPSAPTVPLPPLDEVRSLHRRDRSGGARADRRPARSGRRRRAVGPSSRLRPRKPFRQSGHGSSRGRDLGHLYQVTQLAWSEATYRLGRLEEARFEVDEADLEIDHVFAFIARLGAFCIDGAPVALAAIPARNRTAVELTQVELLDAVARLVLGPGTGAEDLVRAACDDMRDVMERASETVWPCGRQLLSRWTPFPASGVP